MLKLVLNSVNVDLGWGNDKCYSKVKGLSLNELLSDEPKALYGNNIELDPHLQYYVFDLHFNSSDIPVLDGIMSDFNEVLKDSLMLFNSYNNYVEAKNNGNNSFKVVLSDLADYDRVCGKLLKLLPKIYVDGDVAINLVSYDYTKSELKTIPFTSVLSSDTVFDNLLLFTNTPDLFTVPYVPVNRYNDSKNVPLGVLKAMFKIAIFTGDIVNC